MLILSAIIACFGFILPLSAQDVRTNDVNLDVRILILKDNAFDSVISVTLSRDSLCMPDVENYIYIIIQK
jgi:hypothetical protein